MPESGNRNSLREFTILIVEDDESYSQIICTELEENELFKAQFAVVECLSEAIELASKEVFDAVILDLILPDSHGYETLNRFREAAPLVPALVMTGSYEQFTPSDIFREGAQEFLPKGKYSLSVLAYAVYHAIERHRLSLNLKEQRYQLEKSELRIEGIIRSSKDGILIVDENGNVVFANPATSHIFGCSNNELISQPFGFPVIHDQLVELDIRQPNGQVVVAEMRVVGTDWNNQPANLCTLRDITERKRKDENLRLFRDLVESSNDALEVIDPRTARFIDVNEKACSSLGYSREELLSLRVFDIDATASDENWDKTLLTIREVGSVSGELLRVCKDGRRFPVEYNAKLVRIDREYIVAVVRDITERKKAEEKLQSSERRFRALIENSADAILVYDCDSKLIYNSPGVSRVEGYSTSELQSTSRVDRINPDDLSIVKQNEKMVLENPGLPIGFLWRSRHKDGHWLWLEGTATNLLNDPAVGGIVYNYRNVTERKYSEDRIREQATLLDQARDAIVVRDTDDIVRFWNIGAERTYGWSSSEAIGQSINSLFMPSMDAEVLNSAFQELLVREEWTGELTHKRKDGEEIVVQSRWTLLRDDRGEPRSILSINTDVTKQKKLETQVLRTQRMESIGTLASGIAHDLNNVLSPILMEIDLLRGSVKNESILQGLSVIESSVQRGALLVRQVLTYGRDVEGQRSLIKIEDIAKEVMEIVKDTFPPSIHVELNLNEDLRSVIGDSTQMHQIMLNLCLNARDAMPVAGSLVLEVKNTSLTESDLEFSVDAKPGHYVCICVNDTGTGIPTDIQARIFEPFFTTKEVGEGTGLGLYTVAAIVRNHNGFVKLYSDAGKGSSFQIFLPAVSEKVQPKKSNEEGIVEGNGELILVIDDEEMILNATRRILEKYGYRVQTAGNGAEALLLYTRHKDDIAAVITDMAMPVMNGMDTIRALKEINSDIRIIGSSGLGERGVEADINSLNQRLDAFLDKPILPENLLRVLNEVLTSN